MEQRDGAPDPEFWGGPHRDDASDIPRRPRPTPYRRPFVLRVLRLPELLFSRRDRGARPKTGPSARRSASADRGNRRTRPIAAAVLLGTLALGWLAAGHRSRAAGSNPPAALPASVSTTLPASSSAVERACGRPATEAPEVHCTLDGVRLDVRKYRPGTAAAAYRRASGVAARPHTGPPACERGEPDERAWSLPAAPSVAVGRYRCSLQNGRAAMWWTRGDRLLHAVGADADLAALFAWWRAHPID
jgi:hypothetical protein